MKNIVFAIRSLLRKGRHNVMKIVSLGVGLAVGLVLIAKVCFERNYDDFYPDKERIYQIWELYKQGGNPEQDYPRTSGGTAPALMRQVPEIEAATRCTGIDESTLTMLDTKRKYKAEPIFADSCYFDVLPRPMVMGDARQTLGRPMYALVSDRLAERIGGDVVGRELVLDDWPGRTLTIGGVFREVPENAHERYDLIISLPSFGRYFWEGSATNMLGNDRYRSYIKLRPGTDIAAVEERLPAFLATFFPPEEQEKAGIGFNYTFHRLDTLHKDDPEVIRMNWILGILAFALILTAVMNYILIVVSSIVNRAKEIAVQKCYGASERDIQGLMFGEAFVHVALSLALAALLVLAARGTVEELLGTSVGALFLSGGSLVLLAVCVVVFLVSGYLPGWFYNRVPVAAAFRRYRENKRAWKRALLLAQIVATAFLVTLLAFVARQYTFMVNDHPGYAYEDMAYCSLAGVDSTARAKVVDEMRRLPEVAAVTTAYALPFLPVSGNNVYLPGEDEGLFNIADLYVVGDGYFDMMEIPVIQGSPFTEGVSDSREIMVDRRFVEKMKVVAGWTDDVVGRSICVTEHSRSASDAFTIRGVYENFRIGGIADADERPSIMLYDRRPRYNLLVKFHDLDADALAKAQRVVEETFPDRDLVVNTFRAELLSLYNDVRQFRDAVVIGCLVTLLITLIGLVGYTTDEVNRHRKEIAIRRVNGATVWDVQRLFARDVTRVALFAVVVGGGLAYGLLLRWQEQFSEKVPLSVYVFAECALLVLIVVYAVVCLNVRHAAGENPVNSLKAE